MDFSGQPWGWRRAVVEESLVFSSLSDDLLMEHASLMAAAGRAEGALELSKSVRLGWLFPEGEAKAPESSLEGLSNSDKEMVKAMPAEQASVAASLVAQYRKMQELKNKES